MKNNIRTVILCLLLVGLAGCAAPEKKKRILWPAPPQTPRMEFVGLYASEADLKTSKSEKAVKQLLGDTGMEERLVFPYGVVADGKGVVYVSDPGVYNVRTFNFNTKKSQLYLKDPGGKPYRLAIDGQGRFFMVMPAQGNVLVYSAQRVPLFNFGSDVLQKPSGIAIDNERGRIYITDIKLGTIEIFDMGGQHQGTIAEGGIEPGKLNGPSGLAVRKNGNIFVADTLNARIQVFTPEGELVREFGTRSDQISGFELPKDLAFDSEDNLHIVDSRKGGILTYTPEGRLLLYTGMGEPSSHPLGFGILNSIFIDANDRIYLADFLNKRLAIWQYLSKDYLQQNPITEEDLKAYAGEDG